MHQLRFLMPMARLNTEFSRLESRLMIFQAVSFFIFYERTVTSSGMQTFFIVEMVDVAV